MTVEVAKAAFPNGNAVMTIRDELGTLFVDEEFVALYPTIGQPAESPACLALVTILQFMENLTASSVFTGELYKLLDRNPLTIIRQQHLSRI